MTEEQTINEQSNNKIKDDSGQKKHRSPNYPYIGLEDALEKARELQNVSGVHSIRVTTAWETWKYKKGTGNQVVAALDAYGLIEVEGVADRRQIKLTLDARKILDNHSTEKSELLKKAALAPDLHKELWDRYEGDLPPDDRVIREYLKWERNFNPNYVDKFIEQFRATLAFANVSKFDKIDNETELEINSDNEEGGKMQSQPTSQTQQFVQQMPPPLKEGSQVIVDISPSGQINVTFSGAVNEQTFQILNGIREIQEKAKNKVVQNNKEDSGISE